MIATMDVVIQMLTMCIMNTILPGHVNTKHVSGEAVNNTLTIAYIMPWSGSWSIGPRIGGAFILGLEEVRKRNLLPGYNIEWEFRDSACSARQGIRGAIEIWNEVDDLDAIIGPGCSVCCEYVSVLAANWNIPVASFGCLLDLLSDKTKYPTFFRTTHTTKDIAPFYDMICDVFDWQTVGIIATTETVSSREAYYTTLRLESSGKTVFFSKIEPTIVGNQVDEENMEKQREVLKSMKDKVRIIIVTLFGAGMRNLLLSACDEGMLEGDYVFIGLWSTIPFTSTTYSYRPEMDPFLYNGLLSIEVVLYKSSEIDRFARRAIEALQHPAFSHLPHLPATADPDEVGDYAGKVTLIYESIYCKCAIGRF